jgi:hypothetical protein
MPGIIGMRKIHGSPEIRKRFMTTKALGTLCMGTVLFTITPARAQEAMSELFSPEIRQPQPVTEYRFTTFLDQPVGGQTGSMNMMQHDFRLRVPLDANERRAWALHTRLRLLDIDTGVRLPDTGEKFPGMLSDIRVGATYKTELDNGMTGGAIFRVRFAQRQAVRQRRRDPGQRVGLPAHPARRAIRVAGAGELTPTTATFLANVPIPGFAYAYQPRPRTQRWLRGIPFSMVRWRPADRWTVEGSFFIPRTAFAKLSYQLTDPLQLYAAFDWTNQRYFRHERRDDDDRLFYFQKRALAGARWQFDPDCFLDLSGGWAFDRFWFEGEDYGDRGDNRIDISDGPVMQMRFVLKF